MKEAIGGTWIFQIVIFFILLFAGYICLSVNHSKAFSVKDRIIQTIQSHNGINMSGQYSASNHDAIYDIVNYLKESAYRTKGKCPTNVEINGRTYDYQGFDRDGRQSSTNTAFCIAKIETSSSIMSSSCDPSSNTCIDNELPDMAYYRVVVFYQLDLPIFGSLFNFAISGDTKVINVGGN